MTAPRCIGRRVDALTLAFQGSVRGDVQRLLRDALQRAAAGRQGIAVDLAPGVSMVLNPRSRDGWWHLSSDEVSAVVDCEAPGEWRLEVRPRALLLARVSPLQAYAVASALACLVLQAGDRLAVDGEWYAGDARVRRIDLATDWLGFPLDDLTPAAWVTPRNLSVKDMGTLACHSRGGVRTGWMLGRGDVALRVYDKSLEVMLASNAGDKRDEEHARWTAAGWDGREQVTRVEAQVRGGALDDFDMRDPRVLLGNLDGLWAYLTRERTGGRDATPWCRLIIPGTSERRSRCTIDPRWRAVAAVTFDRLSAPLHRESRRTRPELARAASMVLNFTAHAAVGAAQSIVDVLDVDVAHAKGGARETIEGWSERRAREYVVEAIAGLGQVEAFAAGCRSWTQDMLRDRGSWWDAAVYVHNRRQAARARAASIERVLAERRERAALASTRPGRDFDLIAFNRGAA